MPPSYGSLVKQHHLLDKGLWKRQMQTKQGVKDGPGLNLHAISVFTEFSNWNVALHAVPIQAHDSEYFQHKYVDNMSRSILCIFALLHHNW